MRGCLVVVLVLVLLSGCGQVGGLFDLMEMASAVETELEDRHGLKCEIGVNKVNGRLTTITVVIDPEEISDLAIGDVVALIEPSVKRHFQEEPESLVISVTISK